MQKETVLVTGGTGFIAQYCMIALLEAGYHVRTTVRSLSREGEVRAYLKTGGVDAGPNLSFVQADLTRDAGWADACAGCAFVMHGASPTPSGDQTREEDWINPAVEGNLRVLRAAKAAGVRRVVLTSAFGAVGVGHGNIGRPFNETDWTNLSGRIWPYQKSKTLSERIAWDYIARDGIGLELSAINPVAVLGPALGPDFSHSIRLIKNLLEGQGGCPKINSGFVDVRDVADLHLRAMTNPAAAGERFLAISGESLWMIDVARILRQHLGQAAHRVPRREVPNWVIRLAALRKPGLKGIATLLGKNMNASSDKAKQLLGWSLRPAEDAIIATAESLIRLGLVN